MASTSSPAGSWNLDYSGLSPRPSGEESARPAGDNTSLGDESIIGFDGRILVDPRDITDGGKYRSIVKIFSRFSDGASGETVWLMGTGWLARPDVLVTSADVVFDWARQMGAATQVKCYIGYNGRDSLQQPSVQFRAGRSVVIPWEWTQSSNNRVKNVAVVRLLRQFDGALRTFQFANTPTSGNYLLGVVGYPGDMMLRTTREAGAQMYEMFENTTYDLNRSADHMLEYKVTTYKGQSGAPVINRHNFNVFGVHNHGLGGNRNAGSPIGGQYGIDLNTLIGYLDNPSNFGSAGVIVPINVDQSGGNQPVKPDPTPGPDENPSEPTKPEPSPPVVPDPEVEAFLDTFRAVAGISEPAPISTPLLGLAKQAVSIIIGTLLNTITSSATLADGHTEIEGASERASLAEACLPAVVYIRHPQHSSEALAQMEKIWNASALPKPTFNKLAKLLLPLVTNAALEIASNHWAEATGGKRESFGVDGSPTQASGEPAASRDPPVASNSIAQLLPVSPPHSITSQGAKKVIKDVAERLANKAAGSSTGASTSGLFPFASNEEASTFLLKRAFMADIALQVFMAMPQETLDGITVPAPDASGSVQSVQLTDFVKATMEKIGPIELDSARNAAARLSPVLLSIPPAKKPSDKPVEEPSLPTRPAVIDVLKGLKPHS